MLAFVFAAVTIAPQSSKYVQSYRPTGPKIIVNMEQGGSFDITTDPENSPKTVSHILALVKKGFYDRQRIHRVESWVTQWGAPASKTLPLMIKGKNGKM